jgi:hypothetical protein
MKLIISAFILAISVNSYANTDVIDCSGTSYRLSPGIARFLNDSSFSVDSEIQISWLAVNPKNETPYSINSSELKTFPENFDKVVEWVKTNPAFQYVGHNFFKNIGSAYISVKSENRKAVRDLICSMPTMATFAVGYESELKLQP